MQLLDAIVMADRLSPNAYTREEKIHWCDEVTASIRREVLKRYNSIETTAKDGEVELPEGFSLDDVEVAFLNGKPLDNLDLRSFSHLGGSGRLRLVFLERPEPTRQVEIIGEFDLEENFIHLPASPFEIGDFVEWVRLERVTDTPDWAQAQVCTVVDKVYDGLMVDEGAFAPESAVALAVRRMPTDMTQVEPPYDSMYVDYLLAKMALYQHDYAAYGAHMAQYNQMYDAMRRELKNRSPLNPLAGFHNYW